MDKNDFDLGVEIDRIEAKAISDTDCLRAAEVATGLSPEDDKTTANLGLALHIAKDAAERKAWKKVGDTYHIMSWAEFLHVVIDGYGFEVISLKQAIYTPMHGEKKENHLWELIAAHKEKKLLLYATSYTSFEGKESLNGGCVYGRIRARRDQYGLSEALNGCDHRRLQDDSLSFSYDVRTGLITKLLELEESGEFIDWSGNEQLWLLSRPEIEGLKQAWAEGRDLSEEKRVQVLSTAPGWVQWFTGFCRS